MSVNTDANVSHHRPENFNILRRERLTAGLATQDDKSRYTSTDNHRNDEFDLLCAQFFAMTSEKRRQPRFIRVDRRIDPQCALAQIKKRFSVGVLNQKPRLVFFTQPPDGQAIRRIQVRGTLDNRTTPDSERAQ